MSDNFIKKNMLSLFVSLLSSLII